MYEQNYKITEIIVCDFHYVWFRVLHGSETSRCQGSTNMQCLLSYSY